MIYYENVVDIAHYNIPNTNTLKSFSLKIIDRRTFYLQSLIEFHKSAYTFSISNCETLIVLFKDLYP